MSHYNFFITQIIKLGHVNMKLISMNYANYFLSEFIFFVFNKKIKSIKIKYFSAFIFRFC